jgi:hypothetical protein
MTTRHLTATLFVLLLAGTAQAGLTADQKCQQAKLKAQGKLEFCLGKDHAKQVGGGADASAACWAKFEDALAKADAKATKAGIVCRFMDNTDGTVSDLDTGLTWEKKTNIDNVANLADPHDGDNTYTWSATGTAPDGTVFSSFLAALNNGASADGGIGTAITGCFAGACDWRLPSIVELQAVIDLTQCGVNFCLDPAFGPTPPYSYLWTSTTLSGDPASAWDVKPAGGGAVFSWSKTNVDWVVAVRGGFSSAAPAAPTPVPTATPGGSPTPTPECTDASECPASGNECVAATCIGNVCGMQNLGNSHALSSGQTPGDCQQFVCDGAGGVTSIDAPGDLPTTSPSACLINPACSGPGALHPSFDPAAAGIDCTADNHPPAHVCGSDVQAGTCVQCNTNADCPGSSPCLGHTCL